MRSIVIIGFITFVIALTGCSATQRDVNQTAPVVVNVPPLPQPAVDPNLRGQLREDVHQELLTSSQNVNQNMGGLVDVGISKIAEKITGVEAHVDHLMDVNTNITLKATAELQATLKVQVDTSVQLKSQIESQIQLVKDMDVKIGKVQNTLEAQASAVAQLGIGNTANQKTSTENAGGDISHINYLPKVAVDMIVNLAELFSAITTALIGILSTTVVLIFRAQRERETQRANSEIDERKFMNDLLLEVLGKQSTVQGDVVKARIDAYRHR